MIDRLDSLAKAQRAASFVLIKHLFAGGPIEPLERCVEDYQFCSTHMSYNKKRTGMFAYNGDSEVESAEGYYGSEEEEWHVCPV